MDRSAEYLKELVDVTRYGFSRMELGFNNLGNKMGLMLDKQDQMLDKQDETAGEIRGLRKDLSGHIDMNFQRIETYLAGVKTALKEKGII